MKKSLGSRGFVVWSVGLAVTLAWASFGGGGSSVRSGTGAACAGDSIRTLESLQATKRYGKPVSQLLSVDPKAVSAKNPRVYRFHEELLSRLPKEVLKLREHIETRLVEFGDARYWGLPAAMTNADDELEVEPHGKFGAFMKKRLFEGRIGGEAMRYLFDEDLDFTLSPQCRLIQLAAKDGLGDAGNRPVLFPAGARIQDEVELRLLELHEAVYDVGASLKYEHRSPMLTRQLIVALLNPEVSRDAELLGVIELFSNQKVFRRNSPTNALTKWIADEKAVFTSDILGCAHVLRLSFYDGKTVFAQRFSLEQPGFPELPGVPVTIRSEAMTAEDAVKRFRSCEYHRLEGGERLGKSLLKR